LRIAGLGEKSKRGPAVAGLRLLADHRWRGGRCSCLGQVPRPYRPRTSLSCRDCSDLGTRPIILPLEKKTRPPSARRRKAAEKAFGMANLKPRDMNGAEVHDCFSITEIVAYEILGLAEPGKGAELAKSGATALPQVRGEHVSGKIDFEIPVNAGGGLIGDGHQRSIWADFAISGLSFLSTGSVDSDNSFINSGLIVRRSHPASSIIWPVLRKLAPITSVGYPNFL